MVINRINANHNETENDKEGRCTVNTHWLVSSRISTDGLSPGRHRLRLSRPLMLRAYIQCGVDVGLERSGSTSVCMYVCV